MTTCPQHPNATWREVTTGRRVCLMPHPRPVRVHRRPMASRPPRIGLPWRRAARVLIGGTALAVACYGTALGLALAATA